MPQPGALSHPHHIQLRARRPRVAAARAIIAVNPPCAPPVAASAIPLTPADTSAACCRAACSGLLTGAPAEPMWLLPDGLLLAPEPSDRSAARVLWLVCRERRSKTEEGWWTFADGREADLETGQACGPEGGRDNGPEEISGWKMSAKLLSCGRWEGRHTGKSAGVEGAIGGQAGRYKSDLPPRGH